MSNKFSKIKLKELIENEKFETKKLIVKYKYLNKSLNNNLLFKLDNSVNKNNKVRYNLKLKRIKNKQIYKDNNSLNYEIFSNNATNNKTIIVSDKLLNDNVGKLHYFGFYDSINGNLCSNFLKENLHKKIFSELLRQYPNNIKNLIKQSYINIDNIFLNNANSNKDYSGSSSISIIINNDNCYISNLGSSRVILSQNNGSIIKQLTNEHKPENKNEFERIIKEKGIIYQNINKIISKKGFTKQYDSWKLKPSNLSISRLFGFIKGKLHEYGGNNKILISEPDIVNFKIESDFDFIFIGNKEVFDNLNNEEIINDIHKTFKNNKNKLKLSLENIYNLVKNKGIYNNNHTSMIICFNNSIKIKNFNKNMIKSIDNK